MLVFISYPREFRAVAEALDAELKSRRIDTFFDRRQIRPADVWQLEIESYIKNADVFVVLYSPEAAKPGHFFLIETELIRDACERSLQRVIPVIFNPTKPDDIPDFFRTRQIVRSETEGTKRDERDKYWIAQIVQEIGRLSAIRKKLKHRQIIARSALALGAITTVLLSISLVNTKKALTETEEALTDTKEVLNKVEEKFQVLQGKFDGEKLCRSLIGKYTLHQDYVFVETLEKDARSTAINATWKAMGCVPNKRNGDFILEGEDETVFDIQAIINGKYERIGTAKYIYGSEVHIKKDGTLLGRSFEAALDAKDLKPFYKDSRGNGFNESKSFIDKKIEEIVRLRNEKHRIIKTSPCIPMLGETGGKIAIAFVCGGYTRTMVKDKEL